LDLFLNVAYQVAVLWEDTSAVNSLCRTTIGRARKARTRFCDYYQSSMKLV